MPLPEIPLLEESDTFQDLFIATNTSIDRLNILGIANIFVGNGITYTGPNSVGGITLSIDTSSNTFVSNEIGFKVFNSVPSGLTIGSPIGITGATFGIVSNLSLDSSRKYLGIISELYSDGYRITTSGRITEVLSSFDGITGTTFTDNTLYYLSNGGVTSTLPTTNGQVIKPVLFSIGATYGVVVLNQKETLISDNTSYIKSASRTIAEIPIDSNGFSAGNVVFYNITGSTWAKSNAAANNTSEVFGVIESISGSTATIITHGSVNIPNTILHDMGSAGGSGGNDIWFLSGVTSGDLQNLGPTTLGHIIKPVYYAYPHEFSGATFSGLVVNYIGYSVSIGDSTSEPSVLTVPVNSIFADSYMMDPGYALPTAANIANPKNLRIYGQVITSPTYGFLNSVITPLGLAQRTIANDQKLASILVRFTDYSNGYIAAVDEIESPGPAGGDITLYATLVGKFLVTAPVNGISKSFIYIYPGDFAPSELNGKLITLNFQQFSLFIKEDDVIGHVLPDYGDSPYWFMKLE